MRFLMIFLLLATACVQEQLPASVAQDVVAKLYMEHDAQRGPFFQTESRERVDRFFEPSLAGLIWKDAVESKGEVGALDFDPLYDGQDVEPKNRVIAMGVAEGETIRVLVTYDNHNEKRKVTCVVGPDFKITDIVYADGRTLRAVYQ